jgi:phenylpropionate dioxygenase-like ring-hydroxylating dioxygenase large terminal subunit
MTTEPSLPRNCTFAPGDWQVLSALWHPVAFSDQVVDKPVPVRLLDEDLVLYRTSQGVVAAKDICLHRGAQLSLGWMEGDEIVCAYHGFRYNGAGECTRIPAHPELPVSRKLCLMLRRSVERYGLIWVCLSGAPSRQLPDWPEMEHDGYQKLHLQPLEWNTSASRIAENFFDVCHFSWIHAKTFGNRGRPEIRKYDVRQDPASLHMECIVPTQHNGVEGETNFIYDLTLPFSQRLRTEYLPSKDGSFIFVSLCPVSAHRTRMFPHFAKRGVFEDPEGLVAMETKIFSEDRAIAESQRPEELPLDLSEEFHIRADRMSTAYRKSLVSLGLGKAYTA